MRELIDVIFSDNTSYSASVGSDVGGIVIDCPWGPTEKIVSCDNSSFLSYFPISEYTELTHSYLTAYRASLSGLSSLEVVRYKGGSKYVGIRASEEGSSYEVVQVSDIEDVSAAGCILLKYAGTPVYFLNPLVTSAKISVSITEADTVYPKSITIALIATLNGEEQVLESVTGGFEVGVFLDGDDYFIGTKLNASTYFTGSNLKTSLTDAQIFEADCEILASLKSAYTPETTTSKLSELYSTYFSDLESSSVSLILDYGTQSSTEANTLITMASNRTDCCALIGYPTTSAWPTTDSDDPLLTYKSSLTSDMFGAFYAARELYTLYGRSYILNGIGTISGRYAYVASQASVNQLPSARSWGSFSGILQKSFDFSKVLSYHENGINCVYNTVTGPRIFGIRSLHPRASSKFSRFNVSRVCARILKYAFGVAMDAIHTGNTDQRKLMTQNLLTSDLNTLIGQGAVHANSTVQCDNSNNLDINTQGGRILNIDYTLYTVSLIERVKISILATDNSVSSTIS